QSHNSSYTLHRVGLVSRPSVLQYTATGALPALVEEGEGRGEVYDQFSAPGVKRGEGETGNMVFVDGRHSLVSLMCRLVPSPDWFVGVDSVDLCVDAAWVEEITLDASYIGYIMYIVQGWLATGLGVNPHCREQRDADQAARGATAATRGVGERGLPAAAHAAIAEDFATKV
ncbi:unnamed protein product, partial [Plutella xylostella]